MSAINYKNEKIRLALDKEKDADIRKFLMVDHDFDFHVKVPLKYVFLLIFNNGDYKNINGEKHLENMEKSDVHNFTYINFNVNAEKEGFIFEMLDLIEEQIDDNLGFRRYEASTKILIREFMKIS
jgi:hypothetical protein